MRFHNCECLLKNYIPCNKNELVILKSQDEMAGNVQRKDVCYKKREIW